MYLYTKGKQSRETELEKYLSFNDSTYNFGYVSHFKQNTFFKVVTPGRTVS